MEKDCTDSVLDRVRAAAAKETGVSLEDIKPDTTLRTLVNDSLELLSLMVELEYQFGVYIEREDIYRILTVHDAASFIEAQKK